MTIHTGGYMDAHRGLDGRMLWSYRMLYIQHCNNVFVLAQTFTYYKTCTSSWVDNCVYVVDGSISVDVGMGGVVGRETEATQRMALVQVQYINTLIKIKWSVFISGSSSRGGKCLVPNSEGANANPGEGNQCGETSCWIRFGRRWGRQKHPQAPWKTPHTSLFTLAYTQKSSFSNYNWF